MTYKANEAAKILNITVPTLHYYEKAGLLPNIERSKIGARIYSSKDIQWLYMIVLMRETGVPISEIRSYTQLMLEGPETMYQRYELVKKYKESVERKIEKLQSSLTWLTGKMAFYEDMMVSENPCRTFEEEAVLVRQRLNIPINIVENGGEDN